MLENPDSNRRELVKAGEKPWRTIVRFPPEGKAENIAKCFLENSDSYLHFIANLEIEPTNIGAAVDRLVEVGRITAARTFFKCNFSIRHKGVLIFQIFIVDAVS